MRFELRVRLMCEGRGIEERDRRSKPEGYGGFEVLEEWDDGVEVKVTLYGPLVRLCHLTRCQPS
jgi:hypothetical protein